MGKGQFKLDLRGGLNAVFDVAGDRLLATVREVVQGCGQKQTDDLAAGLGLTGSHFSQALNDQGKHFGVKWLPRVLALDVPQYRILTAAADLVSMKVVPKTPLTSEQRLRRVLRHLRDNGANVEEIQRAAYEGEEPDEADTGSGCAR